MGQTRLTLASASPRRRELLAQLGVEFRVEPAHVDETVRPGEAPREYVLRVATEKAEKIAAGSDALVLAADTSVVLGSEILGKPKDRDDAVGMLRRLGGKTHRVITAVTVRRRSQEPHGVHGNPADPSTPLRYAQGERDSVRNSDRFSQGERDSIVVETEVEIRDATDMELDWYVSTGEPMDKAGAYAIQGAGGFLVRAIRGSYSCVVGLPLAETIALLERAGLSLPWRPR